MNSSYEKNDYGSVFEQIVKSGPICNIVEFGVLYGYSTIHLAKGLVHNKLHLGIDGRLNSYDLWERYPYKHTTMSKTQEIINECNFQDIVKLHKGDAFEVYKEYDDESVCLLHVDISNTGETLKKIMSLWNNKIKPNGIILFEGGSVERDKVEWMIKYKMPPIRDEINSNEIINKFYSVKIYDKFPSLTVFCKNKQN